MSSLTLATIIQLSLLAVEADDYQQAYQQSLATGQPLVVLIGADWCPACLRMKNSILPQVARAGGLSNVAFTYVDYDRQRELASKLSRTNSLPQLIRFDRTSSGWKSQLLSGAKSPEEVYSFVKAEPPATANGAPPVHSVSEKVFPTKQAGWISISDITDRFLSQLTQAGVTTDNQSD